MCVDPRLNVLVPSLRVMRRLRVRLSRVPSRSSLKAQCKEGTGPLSVTAEGNMGHKERLSSSPLWIYCGKNTTMRRQQTCCQLKFVILVIRDMRIPATGERAGQSTLPVFLIIST